MRWKKKGVEKGLYAHRLTCNLYVAAMLKNCSSTLAPATLCNLVEACLGRWGHVGRLERHEGLVELCNRVHLECALRLSSATKAVRFSCCCAYLLSNLLGWLPLGWAQKEIDEHAIDGDGDGDDGVVGGGGGVDVNPRLLRQSR